MTCCATGLMVADELERVRQAKRAAIAATPLADEPLVRRPARRARRPGGKRPRQTMNYARRPKL